MKIVVVDDEQDIKTLFQQRFRKEIRKEEFQFEFAFSGKEALKLLETMDLEAVLILSDINMPGMTGLELLGEIRKNYLKPRPIVMMITAYGDEENRSISLKLGADNFLTKPLDFSLLKTKLKELHTGPSTPN